MAFHGNIARSSTIGTNGTGNFSKLRYAFSRLQAVTDSLSVYLSLSGQFASDNLDSSEQLYLGGPHGVRAYANEQGAATQGGLMVLEVRQNLPYQLQGTVFYDAGAVQTWKSNDFQGAPDYNNYLLQGMGLSLDWLGAKDLRVTATLAQRIGALPEAAAQHLTANGGTSQNRFWLAATRYF